MGKTYGTQTARSRKSRPKKSRSRREPGAVLCVVCRTGVRAPADLSVNGMGVMHRRCERAA